MSWEDNPVYAPEKYGFKWADVLELDNEPYQFYELAVLYDGDSYWLTTDSGCSCPSPFESHTVDDLTGPLTASQAVEEAKSLILNARDTDLQDALSFIARIV